MDQKKDKDTQHEMLRTGLRQAVKAFAVLSGVGIYLAVFVGICLFLVSLAVLTCSEAALLASSRASSSAFRVHLHAVPAAQAKRDCLSHFAV